MRCTPPAARPPRAAPTRRSRGRGWFLGESAMRTSSLPPWSEVSPLGRTEDPQMDTGVNGACSLRPGRVDTAGRRGGGMAQGDQTVHDNEWRASRNLPPLTRMDIIGIAVALVGTAVLILLAVISVD